MSLQSTSYTHSSSHHLLLGFIRIGLYALLLTPLLFWDKFLFFHNATKVYFLFFVSEILIVCFLWLIARAPKWRPRFSGIDKLLFLYIGVLVLTSLAGIDPVYSFWGSLDRMTGVLLWLHLAIIFIVAISILRTQQDWYRFFNFSTWIAIIVSSIQLLSLGGVDLVPLQNSGSTFGNSSFLGTYLLFSFFLAVYIVLYAKNQQSRWLGMCACLLFTLTLFTIDANGAQLAFIGGCVLMGALLLILRSKTNCGKYIGWCVIAILVMTFLFSIISAFQSHSFIRQKFIDVSSGSRFVLWNIAWHTIKERPLFGWGLENFGSPALKYFQTCLSTPACGREMWFDRAHNKIFDVWIESGLLGLLSYAAVSFGAMLAMWRVYKKKGSTGFLAAIVITSLAVYVIQNLIVLDTVTSLLFWIFLLAFASSAYKEIFDQKSLPKNARTVPVIFPLMATILFPFSLFFFLVQPIRGNTAYTHARTATTIEQRLHAYEIGTTVSPLGIDMRRVFLADHTASVFWAIPRDTLRNTQSVARRELDLVKNGLLKNRTKTNELRTAIALGILYQTEGHFFDPAAFQQAEIVLKKAVEQYPNHPQPKWVLAGVYLDEGKVPEALALTKSILDESQSEIAYNYYLIALKWMGNEIAFQEQAKKAIKMFPNLQDDISKFESAEIPKDIQTLLSLFHH